MKRTIWCRRRRRLTAVAAVVATVASLAGTAFAEDMNEPIEGCVVLEAESDSAPYQFVEFLEWAEMSDVVAMSREVTGDIFDYERREYIRFDVDNDGTVSEHDVELMLDYVLRYDLFDTVCELREEDWFREIQSQYRTELSEQFNTPKQYVIFFYGFRPDEVVGYYPDCVVGGRIFTIADGGRTGYAIQEDPYFGNVTYNAVYETGDIVVVYNCYVGGDCSKIVRSDEFKVGNVADFGFDYQPSPEIVQRALANIDT